jgi:hypothetical protein
MAQTPRKPPTPKKTASGTEQPSNTFQAETDQERMNTSMGPSPNIFSTASGFVDRQLTASHIAGGLSAYDSTSSLLLAKSEIVDFHKPTELLVSRHYPGYRVFDITGMAADETLGLLLAKSLDSETALEEFRAVLSSPDIPSNIVNALLPRVTLAARRGKYMMTENMIDTQTAFALQNRVTDANVISAISHVITQVLKHMDMVLKGPERKIVRMSPTYTLTMDDIKRVILTESLRDIFSEARISAYTKELDQDATPNLIGEVIANMLRHASHAIPEIRLRLEQLDTVQAIVQTYYREPTALSKTLQASTTLASLAGYANFLVAAVADEKTMMNDRDNSDSREACNAILSVLQSAPSIEVIPLAKFAEYFGLVPCSAADGIYRGLVAYLPLMQQSKLDVVNNFPREAGQELALLPPEYVPTTTLFSEINRSLLTIEAMQGLANMVADEIATARWSVQDVPVLRTIGMINTDVIYLAMARAEIVAVTRSEDKNARFSLIYAAKVSEYWRTRLGASTPSISYFGDPQSLLIYQAGAESKLPTSLPSRPQTLELSAAFDTNYRGAIADQLNSDVAKPLTFSITLINPNVASGETVLKLRISPLELLVGLNPNLERGGAKYSIIKEPGVDRDIVILMSLVTAFAQSGQQVISDKAKSWIIEILTPLATHPAVTRVAIRALNQAVIDAKLDARTMHPQYKEAIVRAYFGTLLALLERFGKIDEQVRADILTILPVNALSVKAALSLATMPVALDASHLL